MSTARRKRLRRYEEPGQARYLTFSCYQRLPLLRDDSIKRIFLDRLAIVRSTHCFRLLAWVIMPEHAHLIVVPCLPDHPVSSIMRMVKQPVSRSVIDRWRQSGSPDLAQIRRPDGGHRFWQAGGGYDRNIRTESDLFEKIQYINDNPAKRGLVALPTDYQWSSARWYAGRSDVLLQLDAG